MTEGRQPFTAEIKTLAKGPSTYDPLENSIRQKPEFRGFKTEERRPDKADPASLRIDYAEHHQRDNAGQDEQAARHDPAARAMHQPADIGGKLLCFGTGSSMQ